MVTETVMELLARIPISEALYRGMTYSFSIYARHFIYMGVLPRNTLRCFMSEKSLKTIDITANKRYNRYIRINVLGLV